MPIKYVVFGLVMSLAGCSGEPERSRMVPVDPAAKSSAVEPDDAVIKNPRRIATH